MNKLTLLELIDFILESIEVIKKRCEPIKEVDDFLADDDNLTRLDAILMRLQASGEALKNLQKRHNEILLQVASDEYWNGIIRFRDLLSHHYTDIQADEVFEICTKKLDILKQKMQQLKESL